MRVLEWSVPKAYDPASYLDGVGMSHLDAAEHAATAELMHGGMTKHEFFVERADAPVRPSVAADDPSAVRSEEHTSELQSLMRISYAVFCLKKKTTIMRPTHYN